MTNKIGPTDHGALGKASGQVDDAGASRKTAGSTDAAARTAQNPVPTNDTVELTRGAKLLEQLEKSLQALPTIDSARVAEVKTAIENGQYQIDAGAIADAMIRLERSLSD